MLAKGVMGAPYKKIIVSILNKRFHYIHPDDAAQLVKLVIDRSDLYMKVKARHRCCTHLPGKGPGIEEEALEDRVLPEGHTQGEAVTGERDVQRRSRSVDEGGLQRRHVR